MLWKSALCKGQNVWANVDDRGEMVVEGGLVAIRYSTSLGSTIYKASVKNLRLQNGEITELAQGEQAPIRRSEDSQKTSQNFGTAKTRTEAQRTAAQKDIRAFLDGLSPETIRCFTDGSCMGNPGPAGTGVYILLQGTEIRHHRYLGQGTNNVAELSAVLDALTCLAKANVATTTPVVVCTDSQYTVGILTKNWKAKANQELVRELRTEVKKWSDLTIRWVAGHADVPENEEADRLANLAIASASKS